MSHARSSREPGASLALAHATAASSDVASAQLLTSQLPGTSQPQPPCLACQTSVTVDAAEASGDPVELARSLNQQGHSLQDSGDFMGAIACYNSCLDVSKKVEPAMAQRIELAVLGNIGACHQQLHPELNQLDDAINCFTQAVDLSKEVGDGLTTARMTYELGRTRNMRGEYKDALASLEHALFLSIKCGSRKIEGDCRTVLGPLLTKLGRADEAIAHQSIAVAISDELEHPAAVRVARLADLGVALSLSCQHAKAVEQLLHALHVAKSVQETLDSAIVLLLQDALANAYLGVGMYEKACAVLLQVLETSRSDRNVQRTMSALKNLAQTHTYLQQYDAAVDFQAERLEILLMDDAPSRDATVSALSGLGHACRRAGRLDEALQHFTQAFDRSQGDNMLQAECLEDLASIYSRLARHQDAVQAVSQALSYYAGGTGLRNREARCLSMLGGLYSQQSPKLGFTHQKQALQIYRETGNLDCVALLLLQMAVSLTRPFDMTERTQLQECSKHSSEVETTTLGPREQACEEALELLQEAESVFDSMWTAFETDEQRVAFGDIEQVRGTSHEQQLLLAAMVRHGAALEVAERARARSFEVLLAQQRLGHGATPSTTAIAAPLRYDALVAVAGRLSLTIIVFSLVMGHGGNEQLLTWVLRGCGGAALIMNRIDIPPAERSLTQLIELTRRTIGARARHGEVAGRSAPELADCLAPAPPLVDEAALAKALSRNRSHPAETGRERDIAELSYSNDDADDSGITANQGCIAADTLTTELLRRCHELLIAPLGLVDGESLLLVPDRDLFALPFAALLSPDGTHLIERHSLRITPSVGTVIELEARAAARDRSAEPTALVVGNPTFGTLRRWAKPLPSAELEARNVCSQLSGTDAYKERVVSLVGDEATKAAVVEAMGSSDIIHLATHGEPGSVLLGGATHAEGVLSMAEVQCLKLNARLVVLSECDSFRGKLTADGVIGITRAFVAAGALSLVASLWKVDDDATKELMERFYSRLLSYNKVAGKATGEAAAAMQGAMVSMIHDGKWSVLEWAAFVVYGII